MRRPRRIHRRIFKRPSVEWKSQSGSLSSAITSTATVTLLNGIAQGTDYNQRAGRKATFRSVMVRGFLENADANNNQVRILLVADKQCNGAAPTVADIITSSNPTNGFKNLDNSSRFKVLGDLRVALNINASGSVRQFKIYRRIYVNTRYDGTGSAVTDITTNSIYLLMVSTDATGGVLHMTDWRIRYTDV